MVPMTTCSSGVYPWCVLAHAMVLPSRMWMQKHSACITSWMEMHTLRDALHYHETHDAEQMVLHHGWRCTRYVMPSITTAHMMQSTCCTSRWCAHLLADGCAMPISGYVHQHACRECMPLPVRRYACIPLEWRCTAYPSP